MFALQFVGRYNANIIPLLTRFTYGADEYLIFPLTDGDLETYMKKNPQPDVGFLENFTTSLIRSMKVLHCPDLEVDATGELVKDRERVDKVLQAQVMHRDLVSL